MGLRVAERSQIRGQSAQAVRKNSIVLGPLVQRVCPLLAATERRFVARHVRASRGVVIASHA